MPATQLAATWGRRLRTIRQRQQNEADTRDDRRKWTQTSVADRAGISRRYLIAIENGERVPSDDVRVNIAAALEVETGEIFTYDLREATS